MKNLVTLKATKEEALKYAYAFMKSGLLYSKECSFVNPNPMDHSKDYLFPRDMYSAFYKEETLPSWESFKSNPLHLSSPAFSCVGGLDMELKKRVVCGYIKGVVFFNCYGDYENEAARASDDIIRLVSDLKSI